MLAQDRDVERVAVLDEDATVAIEDDPARRAQRQRPLVIVLGHLLELACCAIWKNQKPPTSRTKRDEHHDLDGGDADCETAFVFSDGHKSRVIGSAGHRLRRSADRAAVAAGAQPAPCTSLRQCRPRGGRGGARGVPAAARRAAHRRPRETRCRPPGSARPAYGDVELPQVRAACRGP